MLRLRQEHPVRLLCRIFNVSPSGFYSWLSRDDGPKAAEEMRLVQLMEKIHLGSRKNYGSPRVHQILRGIGESISEDKVARLMRKYGIRARTKRKFRCTTDSKHKYPVAANKLDQKFKASEANRIWVGDITYIGTDEGWLYLACLMDIFSRKIVGWAFSERIDRELVIRALKMAVNSRNPTNGLLHHTDRGSQYASHDYQELLDLFGMDPSMSRKGNCYDNSMMESFFATLKREHVYWEKYETRAQAKQSVFHWIEATYNRERIHSGIGYLTPEQFETKCA